MKVLWITNLMFPDVCKELGICVPEIGGWVHSAAQALLAHNKHIHFAVATMYGGEMLQTFNLRGITYYLVPKGAKNNLKTSLLERYWVQINTDFAPDVVHIHGTEYAYGLTYLKACGNHNVVTSIQGLVSICQRYYYGGISEQTLIGSTTLRDIVRRDTVFAQRADMRQRGMLEIETLRQVKHVIGRTNWDKVHAMAFNSNINYHYCNETLREPFYREKWNLEKCERNSIFISQAYYPLKGLHQLLLAMPLITRHYPETKLYVAGHNFVATKRYRLTGYGKYIRAMIAKNKLSDHVIFTGKLSENDMCTRYLQSHVFVCPSIIENSSNSLGEAQMLGVPCVASYVGGTPDLVTHNQTGLLYRYEDTEMLAEAVCKIFGSEKLTEKLSENGRYEAILRHNKMLNAKRLGSIYENILETSTTNK